MISSKSKISQILKTLSFFFFPKLQTLHLFASTKKWLSREQNFQTLKNFQSSNLGFFPFLLVPNIYDSQAFHFFDCLWRLNLKIFKMKKQIWLHVFNDFKSFLAKGIELTFKHHDWRKEVVQRISLCSFKKKKKKFKTLFKLHLDLILYERGTWASFPKARSQSLNKKIHFFQRLKIKTFLCVNLG